MKLFKYPLLAAVMSSGCISHYQYQSQGVLEYIDGPHQAILYWGEDDGFLWYGKKYNQMDSTVTLRTCGLAPTQFTLNNQNYLVLIGRASDISHQHPEKPITITSEQSCGEILLNEKPASSQALQHGSTPHLEFWCSNSVRPLRYPLVGQYKFSAISKEKASKQKQPPNPCALQPTNTNKFLKGHIYEN